MFGLNSKSTDSSAYKRNEKKKKQNPTDYVLLDISKVGFDFHINNAF